jgi:hypothetical protein
LAAKLRKHFVALAALAAFFVVFFFPVIFMGRVVSPNDVFYNYQPWATYKPPTIVRAQNDLMNDPATGYLPRIVSVKRDWSTFHWDPEIGSGIPGFGSAGEAMFTPFSLLPALLVPVSWVYTAMIFLKVVVAFWFAYLWLREERLGKRGAAIGALVIACAGVYSVRYLWHLTNPTPLYPALLWLTRRAFDGKRTSIALTVVIAFSYAMASFPAAMAYGAWLCIAYALFLAIRHRRVPLRTLSASVFGVVLALMIVAAPLVSYVRFIGRTGYLPVRTQMTQIHYPWSHWRSFIWPQRLGNPALKNWTGDRALGDINNYIEATIYVGVVCLPLMALAVLHRRQRHRWFWIGTTGVLVLIIFGAPGVTDVIGKMPGFRYSALSRVVLLLPVAAGFVAASGAAFVIGRLRRRSVAAAFVLAGAIAVGAAWDFGVFAGTFHPFLTPEESAIPTTPVIEYLRADAQPFRIAGFFSYLWPNSAQLYAVQDVASHFHSEADYRRMLMRVDPTSWSGSSTVIQFNSLKFNFTDPLVSMLGIRYLIEPRPIDIVKWTVFAATKPGVEEKGAVTLSPGTVVQRTIPVGDEPFWAIEIPVNVSEVIGALPRLDAELVKNSTVVWSRTFSASDIRVMNKVYIPLRPYAGRGEVVTLRLWSNSMRVGLLRADAPAGESPLFYGQVTIPIIFDREFPDGRIFRNLAEIPRFHAVKRLRKLHRDEFLYARDTDFSDTAIITEDPVFPPDAVAADARVELVRYTPAEQHVATTSSGPMFLASSEKLTPELEVTIDGEPVRPVQINMLFAGVTVPAGKHNVVFNRQVGRGWWWVSITGAVLFALVAALELTVAWRRR